MMSNPISGAMDVTQATINRCKYEIVDGDWTTKRKVVGEWFGSRCIPKQQNLQDWHDLAMKEAIRELAQNLPLRSTTMQFQNEEECVLHSRQVMGNLESFQNFKNMTPKRHPG